MGAAVALVLCEAAEAERVAVSLVKAKLAGWVDVLPDDPDLLGFHRDAENSGDALLIVFSIWALETDLFEHLRTLLGPGRFSISTIPAADAPAPVTEWLHANVREEDRGEATYVEPAF